MRKLPPREYHLLQNADMDDADDCWGVSYNDFKTAIDWTGREIIVYDDLINIVPPVYSYEQALLKLKELKA